MSKLTDVRLGINLLKDGNLSDRRPAWWVIVFALFFILYIIYG